MRSLSQLNTRGQTSLPYTDNRPAGVVYDRATPTAMTAEVISAGAFTLIPGIEVLDISQPDALNFVYVIDISQIYPASFAIAGYTTATTLTVLNAPSTIRTGALVSGGGSPDLLPNTYIVNQITPLITGETLGGRGRYTITVSQDVNDAEMIASITDTGTVTVINSYSGIDTFECNTICFLTPNMPITFTGSVFGFITSPINLNVTSSNGTTNRLSVSDTSSLTADMAIIFASPVFGGVIANTVYYVKNIVNSTQFTISETLGGSEFDLSDGSGTMPLRQSYFVKTVSITEFSISLTPGGAVVQLTESNGSMTASGNFGALRLVVTSSGGAITTGSLINSVDMPVGVSIVAQVGGGSNSAGTYSLAGPAVALGSRQMYSALNFSNTNPRGSVTWATTPAGVTVSQTLGVYTVSLDTSAQWDVMRNPTVTLPANWADDFQISSYVDTDIAASKNWTTTVDVTFGANITSTSTISARLNGTQRFSSIQSALFAQAVLFKRTRATPAAGTAIVNIVSSPNKLVGVSSVIQSISSLTGSIAVIRRTGSAITAQATLSAPRIGMFATPAALTVTSTLISDVKVFRNLVSTNLAAQFTATPTANNIPLTVTVSADSVSDIYNNWYYGKWFARTFAGTRHAFAVDGPSAGIRILSRSNVTETDLVGDRWNDAEEYIGVNSDFSRVAFAIRSNINVHGVAQTDLYMYSRSGSTWSRDNRFDSLASYSSSVCMSKDGNYVALHTYDDGVAPINSTVRIYQYSAGTWSLLHTMTLSGVGSITGFALNNDGTYLAVDDNIYVKSGSTWVFQQSLGAGSGLEEITLTDAGDYAVIGCDSQSPLTYGAIKVFKRTGTSWALEQTLNYESPAENNFGDSVTTDGTITNIQTSSLTRLVTFTRI